MSVGDRMKASDFEFVSFRPREGVREAVDGHFQRFLETVLPGSSVRGKFVDQGDGFLLHMAVIYHEQEFSSELFFAKTVVTGRPRNWQIDEVVRLLQELKTRVQNWVRSQPLVPVPMRNSDDESQ